MGKLLDCPMCLGFWVAVALCVPFVLSVRWLLPYFILAVAGVGLVLYEWKQKHLPCVNCGSKVSLEGWEIV